MQSGDLVILFVREGARPARVVLKTLEVGADGVFVSAAGPTPSDPPERTQLRPERLEVSPTHGGTPRLFLYQDDIVRP